MNRRRTLAALGAVPVVAHLGSTPTSALAAPVYTITDLGVIPRLRRTVATGINTAGQIAGTAEIDVRQETEQHAFRWARGKLTDLGTLPAGAGFSLSHGLGISPAGDVVGYAYLEAGADRACL